MVAYREDTRSGRQGPRTVAGIAILVCAGAVLAQTAPQLQAASTPIRAGMDDVIVQTASATPRSLPFSFGSSDLQTEVEALRAENRRLAIWRDAATSMSERMARYEELLGLMSEPIPDGVSARVVTEANASTGVTRLANAGRRNGVQVGDIAINTEGVVGRVIRVGERSSRILLVTDFNSRVPIMGELSGVRGILAGQKDGNRRVGAILDRPETDPFIEGETLITTGEGNAYPRGLRVGQAVQVNDQWGVVFAMSSAPMDFVRILPAKVIPTPEDEPVIEMDAEQGDEPSVEGAAEGQANP